MVEVDRRVGERLRYFHRTGSNIVGAKETIAEHVFLKGQLELKTLNVFF